METVQLRQKRRGLVEQMQEINILARKEGREVLNAEELLKWNKINEEVKLMKSQYEAIERMDELEKEAVKKETKHKDSEQTDTDLRYLDVMEKYIRSGVGSLDQRQKEVLQRTQITTTDSLGGYLVTDKWYNQIIETLLYYAGIYDVARKIKLSQGGTLNIPTLDDTGNVAGIVAQGVATTKTNYTYGEVQIIDYTYTTMVKVAEQLITDSAYDLAGHINETIGARHGRILNTHATTGDGSSKPFGVVTGATDSTITTATATAVTRANIVDFLHKVDVAYRRGPKVRFMMHDSTLSAIKQLDVGTADARPLWQSGIATGAPDTLEGYEYVINNDMAEIGSAAKFMLFGDFDKFAIKEVGGFGIKRTTERFVDELAVGYLGWKRWGSKIMDPAAIKWMDNAV